MPRFTDLSRLFRWTKVTTSLNHMPSAFSTEAQSRYASNKPSYSTNNIFFPRYQILITRYPKPILTADKRSALDTILAIHGSTTKDLHDKEVIDNLFTICENLDKTFFNKLPDDKQRLFSAIIETFIAAEITPKRRNEGFYISSMKQLREVIQNRVNEANAVPLIEQRPGKM